MSYFNVTILGCGSASPTVRHFPSAQALVYNHHVMLIDCGEGAQMQLRRYKIPFNRIDNVFLSHLHGDHILGLPGLLSTLSLHEVEGSVTVHTFADGAKELKRMIDFVGRERTFKLDFDIIDPAAPGVVYEDNNLKVTAFPLRHRVPCVGYRFDEKPKRRHIDGDAVRFYGVPYYLMDSLREGMDLVLPDGTVVPNERLTSDPTPSMSYAYCSDTVFDPSVAEAVRGVDVLYHEATYGDDAAAKAQPCGHSTARQAGMIARMAGVKTLVLGHFSQSVPDEADLARQAAEEFDGQVIVAHEGLKIDLA